MATCEQQPMLSCETYNYSADTANVMSILVKSIYTNKDIFLRELISNASDAINKICSIDPKYTIGNEIKISYDKKENQLIIQDTGCGISKQDLISKIGSIGTSGTKQFMENIVQGKIKDNLIGQFGVGFYSVYLVSKHIQIITKPVSENKIWEWSSESESSYSIKELNSYENDSFIRGTKIILTLNKDSYEYLEEDHLIEIIKTHSSYIEYPIMFEKQTSIDDDDKNEYDVDKDNINDIEKDKNVKKNNIKRKFEKMNWIPLWAKPKSEITDKDYIDFYLHNIQDNIEQSIKDPPLIYKHFKIEGEVNFTALLYIPTKAPYNLFEPSKRGQSLKLYTKNVLITADHKDLYPKWMEFVKGIVDTSDIELNVSRQTVQNTKKLRKIYNQLVKKVIEMIEELADDTEKYNKFYKEFSCSLKNGTHEEYNRDYDKYSRYDNESDKMIGHKYAKQMLKLLRYNTSLGKFIGFDDYVKTMKLNQKAIYYIAGDKKESLVSSPFMDKFKLLGLEVLYFEEPIDEYIKPFLTEYKVIGNTGYIVGINEQGYDKFKEPDLTDLETKTFVDISRDKLLLSEHNVNTDINTNINAEQGNILCAKIKELYDKIGIIFHEVKLDDKISSMPAIIVNHVHMSAQLEKILNNSTSTKRNEQYKHAFDRKDMLISNSNKISQYFYQKLCIENIPLDDPNIIEYARVVYTCALLSGGYEPDNVHLFTKNIAKLLEYKLFN